MPVGRRSLYSNLKPASCKDQILEEEDTKRLNTNLVFQTGENFMKVSIILFIFLNLFVYILETNKQIIYTKQVYDKKMINTCTMGFLKDPFLFFASGCYLNPIVHLFLFLQSYRQIALLFHNEQ